MAGARPAKEGGGPKDQGFSISPLILLPHVMRRLVTAGINA
jgi:hypothetical protein